MEKEDAFVNTNWSTLIKVTIVCNLALLSFSIFLWVEETINDERFFIYSGLTLLPLLNIYAIVKNKSKKIENIPGIIGLYLKRKRLEEEKRIRELEEQSNK